MPCNELARHYVHVKFDKSHDARYRLMLYSIGLYKFDNAFSSAVVDETLLFHKEHSDG